MRATDTLTSASPRVDVEAETEGWKQADEMIRNAKQRTCLHIIENWLRYTQAHQHTNTDIHIRRQRRRKQGK